MKKNYKTVFIILFFLLLLSVGISVSNYLVSLKSMQTQIKTQSLPLSVDNIYTEIQKNIIEPSIIASMMSSDTFVVDWLKHDEKASQKIQEYLENIKNKYGTIVAFLVSKKSLNYYTHNGILKQLDEAEPEDAWYYRFKDIGESHEINLDWNQHISNNMIMFINYKIFDRDYQFLGATGVGIQISYIHEMLQMFQENYNLHVSFVTHNGDLLLSQNDAYKALKNIYDVKELKKYSSTLLSKNSKMIEYERDGDTYILNTKYIPELNTFILVEANLDDFTATTKNVFYFNLGISLLLTLVIAMIIITIIRNFQTKLEELAGFDTLTGLDNRRSFSQKLHSALLLAKRNKEALGLLFIDIDDFKNINDTLGHHTGDLVLQNFALFLQSNIRETDLCARWGGEEFILVFIGSNAQDALLIANTLREKIRQDATMHSLIKYPLTISAGLTHMREDDTVESIISRADRAMYISKNTGKDRVNLLNT